MLNLTEELRSMSNKKTDNPKVQVKKNEVIENAEKDGFSMTYHSVLCLIEVLLIIRCLFAFFSTFASAYDGRWIDQTFYIVEFILATLALVFHSKKNGCIALCMFILVYYGQNIVVFLVAKAGNINVPNMNTQFISYTFGALVWLIPTILYYKKRWKYLK